MHLGILYNLTTLSRICGFMNGLLDTLKLCLRVFRGRKGKAKEENERKGREERKEGKPSPYLRVKKTNKKRRWRTYLIILLFYLFSLKINTVLYFVIHLVIYSKQFMLFKTTYLYIKKRKFITISF